MTYFCLALMSQTMQKTIDYEKTNLPMGSYHYPIVG